MGFFKTRTVVKTDEVVMTEEVVHKTSAGTSVALNKSFNDLILYNFKTVHPLTTVSRVSVVTSLMLKISIFMYNIFNFFGFNVLFYDQDMIGKKMDDRNRDNIGYLMNSDAQNIVYSLLITMAPIMIIRAITLVTTTKKDKLSKQLHLTLILDGRYDSTYHFLCVHVCFEELNLYRRSNWYEEEERENISKSKVFDSNEKKEQ